MIRWIFDPFYTIPRVTIEIGTDSGTVETITATATTATGAGRDRLLTVLKDHPHIAAHQDRTDRKIPIVVIEP